MEQTQNQYSMPPPQWQQQQPVVRYAGFWKRFAAYFIDKLIIGVAATIILLPFIAMMGMTRFMSRRGDFESMGLFVSVFFLYFGAIFLIVVAEWLYFAIMESRRGATIGKMALGIVVTDLSGQRITFGRATGRYFSKILSGMILYVGFMMAGWTQQKQALHDILAGTLVLEKGNNFF